MDESKIAELKKAKELLDAEAAERRAGWDLEALELEVKLSRELGPRREAFEIVQTPVGPFALKLGDSVTFKRLQSTECKHEDQFDFVLEQIAHPDADKARAALGRYRGLVPRCWDVLVALHRGELVATQGK